MARVYASMWFVHQAGKHTERHTEKKRQSDRERDIVHTDSDTTRQTTENDMRTARERGSDTKKYSQRLISESFFRCVNVFCVYVSVSVG